MFITVISFLPFAACLFWLVLNPLTQKGEKAFRTLEVLLGTVGIVSMAQAGISCSNGNTMLSFFLIKQFIAPLLIPVAILYINSLLPDKGPQPAIQAWIAIPVALLFAESILIMLSGTDVFVDAIGKIPAGGRYDRIENLIHLCSFWVFYIVLAAQLLIWVVFIVIKTAKGTRHIQLFNCTAVIIALTVLEITGITTGVSTLFAALIVLILSCAIYYTSYKGVFHVMANIQQPETKMEMEAETEKRHRTAESPKESGGIIADAHQSQADEEDLRIRFEDLIVTEQLFLKQGIRISDIASRLETNRTYVSRLVNNTYNMSFSDYINTLRIDYAEQYLLHHRDARQSDIAEACGFPNASAFNNVFKKITGVTPKIWLASNNNYNPE